MPEIKDIELRSDRVRKIVGKIPPAIDRYGISVIGLLLVVMVGVSMIIPYKETVCLPVSFSPEVSSRKGIALADSQQVASLGTGMYMSFDMFGEKEEAIIKKISSHRINGKYQVEVELMGGDEITIPLEVEGKITILEKTWFQMIVGK